MLRGGRLRRLLAAHLAYLNVLLPPPPLLGSSGGLLPVSSFGLCNFGRLGPPAPLQPSALLAECPPSELVCTFNLLSCVTSALRFHPRDQTTVQVAISPIPKGLAVAQFKLLQLTEWLQMVLYPKPRLFSPYRKRTPPSARVTAGRCTV